MGTPWTINEAAKNIPCQLLISDFPFLQDLQSSCVIYVNVLQSALNNPKKSSVESYRVWDC